MKKGFFAALFCLCITAAFMPFKAVSADAQSPVLTGCSVYRSGAAATTVRLLSDTAGNAYYKISDNDTPPDAADIAANGTDGGTVTAGTTTVLTLSGLTAGAKYAHIAVKDASDNLSNVLTVAMPRDVYFFDDFEAYPINTQGGNEALSLPAKGSKTAAAVVLNESRAMKITANYDGPREPVQYAVLPENTSGLITLEAKISPTAVNGGEGSLCLYDNAANQIVASVGAYSNLVWAYASEGIAATRLSAAGEYTVGTWYTVRLEYDTAANAYDAYIDGVKANSSPITGSGARNAYALALRVYDSGWQTDSSFCFDDVKFEVNPLPVINGNNVYRNSIASATVNFLSNAAGNIYYKISDSFCPPEAADIAANGTEGGTAAADTANVIMLSDLTAGAKYVHITIKDANGNLSNVLTVAMPHDIYFLNDFETYPLDPQGGLGARIKYNESRVMRFTANYDYGREPVKDIVLLEGISGLISIEARIKPIAVNGGEGSLYLCDGSNHQIIASVNAASSLKWTAGTTQLGDAEEGIPYTVGTWYTVRMEYDSTANTYDVYIDGVKANSSPITGGGAKDTYVIALRVYDSGWQTDSSFCFDDVKFKVNPMPVINGNNVYRSSAAAATVGFMSNAAGNVYYEISDSDTPPDAADIAANGTEGGTAAADTTNIITLSGLTAGVKYAHIIVKDANGNLSNVLTVAMPHDIYFLNDFEAYPVDPGSGKGARIKYNGSHVVRLTANYDNTREPVKDIVLLEGISGLISIEARIKPIAVNGGEGSLYLCDGTTRQIIASVNAASSLKWTAGTTQLGDTEEGIPYTVGTWYNVKLEYDSTSNTYDVYIDGVKANSSPITGGGAKDTYVIVLRVYDYGYSSDSSFCFDNVKFKVNPMPVINGNNVYRNSAAAATVGFMSNAVGNIYYEISDSDTPPDAADIAASGTEGGTAAADTTNVIALSGLTAGAQYAHIIIKDANGNLSNVLTVAMPLDVYFYDDFEAYPVDPESSRGARIKYNGSRVMQFTANYDYTREPVKDVAVLEGKNELIVIETKIKPIAVNGGDASLYLCDGSNRQIIASVNAASSLKWTAGATQLGDTEEGIPYTVGTWYNIKLEYDTAANTYDVYIDGVKANSSPIAGGGTRDTYVIVLRVYDSGWSTDSSFCFDDVKFYETVRLPIAAFNTPAPSSQNGITATVTFSPESPQRTGTSVTATITLSGTAAAAGIHTVGLTSAADIDTINAPAIVTETVTVGQEMTEADIFEFTFTVPAEDADDLTLIHTFKAAHVHDYGTTWKNDDLSHWHECSCGEKADLEAHDFKWVTDKEATATEPGSKHEECKICGYKKPAVPIEILPHTHEFGTGWKSDDTSHWHECSCGEKADLEAHDFKWVTDKEATATEPGSKHEECKICGYKKPAVPIPATGGTDPNPKKPAKSKRRGCRSSADASLILLSCTLLAALMVIKRKMK